MSFPTVGIIGAGQLARMTIAPATQLGVNLRLFAASASDSAALGAAHVVGDFTKSEELIAFAQGCDVISFEHELVPQHVIRAIEATGVKVYPRADSFIFSQDKISMRHKMDELGIKNPAWEIFDAQIPTITFPLIAKSSSGGYDGRGVFVVENLEELQKLRADIGAPLLLEEKLAFARELAIMVARSPHGQAATWAPTLTVQSDGICTMTVTPAPEISDELAVAASTIALRIADGVNLVGVMAVELFEVNGELIVNELAMRPHNSGHWTIEGAVTSQFEQHLRAILDLPLGATALTGTWAVMGNVLGGEKGDMYRPYLHLMARTPALKFHQYRKEVRPGRKIGHVTLIGDNLPFVKDEVSHAVDYLSGAIDE